jgi:uncharacterized protein (TIGR02145 family)
MKRAIIILIITGFISTLLAQDATLIYKNTVNSTVTIETDIALGSGFFVADSVIATNYHVIDGATEAFCYTDNSSKKYKIEGYLAVDKSIDLILLKVHGLNRKSLKMSPNSVIPGQKVFVIGSPKGLPATISDGIVSGLRDFNGYRLIQISAPISPGSSGGPVFDGKGELIGVSVAQFEGGQNLNFAIPKSNLDSLLMTKATSPLPITSLYSLTSSIIDQRDGKSYKTKKIGNQTWMLENLNFDTHPVLFENQPSISSDSWCYEGNSLNCSKYVILYILKYAMNVCPQNWHLPSYTEWITLINFLGGENIAGGKLKSQTGWNDPSNGGTNEISFSALPGGWGAPTMPSHLGNIGLWWSSTEANTSEIYSIMIYNNKSNVKTFNYAKIMGASVRCIKD